MVELFRDRGEHWVDIIRIKWDRFYKVGEVLVRVSLELLHHNLRHIVGKLLDRMSQGDMVQRVGQMVVLVYTTEELLVYRITVGVGIG